MPDPRPLFVLTGGTRLTDAWLDQPVPDDPPHYASGISDWLEDAA